MSLRQEDFAEILVQRGHCGDSEEASVLADLVYQEITILSETTEDDESINPTDEEIVEWNSLIQDLLGVEEDQAKILLKELFLMEDEMENEDDSENDVSNEDVNDEDEFPLFDGECDLCDRYIRLTKHHLIPKSTWHRLENRLRNAADAKQKGDIDRASMILGPGLMHTLDRLEPKRSTIRAIMCVTCDICAPCHSTIHHRHDNLTLALSYSRVDLILEDEQIAKYCKWASKQRAGKYAKR